MMGNTHDIKDGHSTPGFDIITSFGLKLKGIKFENLAFYALIVIMKFEKAVEVCNNNADAAVGLLTY